MPSTFLGKPIPRHRLPERSRPQRNPVLGIALLGLAGLLAVLAVQLNFAPAGLVSNAGISWLKAETALAASPTPAVSLSPRPSPSPTPYNSANDPCSLASLRAHGVNPTILFPFVPPGLLSPDDTGCSPARWGLDVFKLLTYKILGILNWLAFTLAIIFTVYAGLLYVAGFANEANVKKAKSILIACYVGLAVVIGARIILYGTISAFSNGNITPNEIEQVEVEIGATPTPASTPAP